MRKDHRPYFIKRAYLRFQEQYTRCFIKPQLTALGPGFTFIRPWNIEIFGAPITIGSYANILTTSDNKVRLTVWPEKEGMGEIVIGDCCLICPGVRISSAAQIVIEDSCMMASNSLITDADWHGTYDRVRTIGSPKPVHIRKNAWLGDGAIVCKGVTIGQNSIVGAGSVVVRDIPPNVIAAGNPARVVRELDPDEPIVTRASWFSDAAGQKSALERMDQEKMAANTLLYWLKTLVAPGNRD